MAADNNGGLLEYLGNMIETRAKSGTKVNKEFTKKERLQGESYVIRNHDRSRIKFATPSSKLIDSTLSGPHTRRLLENTREINDLFEDSRPFFSREVKCADHTKTYPSGSKYSGHWSENGWEGGGQYTYPHGVRFVGEFRDSQQHGHGVLVYPMGQRLKGLWRNDKLINWTYTFSDGTEYSEPWGYCTFPDRRYATTISHGMRPPYNERITADIPARPIPDGCYDVGEGFYNPKIRCIVSVHDTNKILRIPNSDEEIWIIKHCRKSFCGPVGYCPELYEYWTNGSKQSTINILESRSVEGDADANGEGDN